MTFTQPEIVSALRTAIDDIVQASVTDSFTDNTDAELWQAACQAVQALLEELPLSLLEPTAGTSLTATSADGAIVIELADFVRFVDVKIGGWNGVVSELMEPDSDEAKRQRSTWSRGSAEKPRAMLGFDSTGKASLYCWPSGNSIVQLNYIKTATITPAVPAAPEATPPTLATPASLTCAIKDEAERLVIYRAASIFFEGKKESEIAGKFREMSITA